MLRPSAKALVADGSARYLNLDDPELTNAMERLSEEIGRYLAKYKLTAELGKGE
ncbi:MAG: hypothetical protein WKF90_04625 [Pyrinomonadaceae bacterium]